MLPSLYAGMDEVDKLAPICFNSSLTLNQNSAYYSNTSCSEGYVPCQVDTATGDASCVSVQSLCNGTVECENGWDESQGVCGYEGETITN